RTVPGPGDIPLHGRQIVVFAPAERQSVEEVQVFDDRIVATIYDNVRGRAMVFEEGSQGWSEEALPVPENASVHLGDSSRKSGRIFYSVEGFLIPSTLSLADAGTGAAEILKAAPARFDASTHVVE